MSDIVNDVIRETVVGAISEAGSSATGVPSPLLKRGIEYVSGTGNDDDVDFVPHKQMRFNPDEDSEEEEDPVTLWTRTLVLITQSLW